MKKALTVGAAVVFVVIGGVLFFKSTEPNGSDGDELVPEEPMILEEKRDDAASSGGQFLQMEPDAAPPSDASNDGNDDLPELPSGGGVEVKTDGEETGDKVVSEAMISMTDMGFVPNSVTVEAGTEVTFVNDGQALHWPASDLHPTHELLAGFDAGQGLNTGESYSYTFKDAGTWKYHDNLFPNLGGEIIVE